MTRRRWHQIHDETIAREQHIHMEAYRSAEKGKDDKRASEYMLQNICGLWWAAEFRRGVDVAHDEAILMDDAVSPRKGKMLRFR